jgi:regulator of sirC expression with transglutaminase-like and TPR domain
MPGFLFYAMSDQKALGQISYLIQLLTDRDAFVREKVRLQLIELGEDALPFLEMAVRGEDVPLRVQAREVISAIFPKKLGEKFRQLAQKGLGRDVDLETGMLLVMEFGYPDSNPEACRENLDSLAHQLEQNLAPDADPSQTVLALTHLLFQQTNFRGNQKDYLNPDNTYLNKVLEHKTGLPITLSALCVLVAGRLGLPIVGVGLPGHYIAKYNLPKNAIYFDPFHQGRLLTRADCIQIVEQFGQPFEEHFLSQSTHRETLIRMMNNLIQVYQSSNEPEKAETLSGYIKILLNPSKNPFSENTQGI